MQKTYYIGLFIASIIGFIVFDLFTTAGKHVTKVQENVSLKVENIQTKQEVKKLKVENKQLKQTVNSLQNEIQKLDSIQVVPIKSIVRPPVVHESYELYSDTDILSDSSTGK